MQVEECEGAPHLHLVIPRPSRATCPHAGSARTPNFGYEWHAVRSTFLVTPRVRIDSRIVPKPSRTPELAHAIGLTRTCQSQDLLHFNGGEPNASTLDSDDWPNRIGASRKARCAKNGPADGNDAECSDRHLTCSSAAARRRVMRAAGAHVSTYHGPLQLLVMPQTAHRRPTPETPALQPLPPIESRIASLPDSCRGNKNPARGYLAGELGVALTTALQRLRRNSVRSCTRIRASSCRRHRGNGSSRHRKRGSAYAA